MPKLSETELLFLELLKAGLWEKPVRQELYQEVEVDWDLVAQLARHHTVTGLVGEAMSHLPHGVAPRPVLIPILRKVVEIEDRNRQMNSFIPQIFLTLKAMKLHPWLIKGQGVGQDYEDPMKRVSGDVDVLFVDEDEYDCVRKVMLDHLDPKRIVSDVRKTKNLEFFHGDILIEFHGLVLAEVNHKCDRHFSEFMSEKRKLKGRTWNGVPLAPFSFDAIFIFTHLVRHYFGGGIGLRQVCDWMRFLHRHVQDLDLMELEQDLRKLGMYKLWQVFGAMAVQYLGCPQENMPFYRADMEKQGARVLRYILESGNFGYYDKRTQSSSNVFFVRRFKAFWGHLQMKFQNFTMFPEESVYSIPSFIVDGIKRSFRSKEQTTSEN